MGLEAKPLSPACCKLGIISISLCFVAGTENGVYIGVGNTQPGMPGHWVGGNARHREERRRPCLPLDDQQTQTIELLCVFGDWHTVVLFLSFVVADVDFGFSFFFLFVLNTI